MKKTTTYLGTIGLLMIWAWNSQAQSVGGLLPSIEVVAKKQNVPMGFKTQTIDSTDLQHYTANSLAELLAYKTPVFIKSYGVGGLASPSFRGTAAHHTQLIWNGMSLNSPMLGATDLSLLSVAFADEVALCYGGGSALAQGSGGLGGAILLNSKPEWSKKLSVNLQQTLGSYGLHDTQAKIQVQKGKWLFVQRAFLKSAKNDFKFINKEKFGQPYEYFDNAAQQQHGIMQDIYRNIGENQTLSAHIWYQNAKRELGSPMIANGDQQQQNDQTLRALTQWKQHTATRSNTLRLAFFKENYQYERHILQSPVWLSDKSHSNIIQLNGFTEWHSKQNWQLKIGGNFQYEQGFYQSLNNKVTQWRTGIYGDFTYNPLRYWQLQALLRAEQTGEQLSPLLPSLGSDLRLLNSGNNTINWRANIAKNYRVPTLNERFRILGQNDLKAEQHQTIETALSWESQHETHSHQLEITGFRSLTDNWIVWLRQGRSGLSKPTNLRKVQVSGLEINGKQRYRLGSVKVLFQAAYTFTQSRNLKAMSALDASVGKQMIYMPRHSTQLTLHLAYKQASVSLENSYNSQRYTDTNNLTSLAPYTLTNLQMAYNVPFRNNLFSVSLRINNLTQTNYQSVAFYPMPLRNGTITLLYRWG